MTQFVVLAVVVAALSPQEPARNQARPPRLETVNALSAAERAAGWRLLFDGKNTSAWRAYRDDAFPSAGWRLVDGCLQTQPGEGATDIVSVEQFGDFELLLDWKVEAKGNSGIIYRVREDRDATWQSGPEYQILDDEGHGFAPDDPHSAGALYDLAGPSGGKATRPLGEFNRTRIRVKDGLIQHWLNGVKVVECRADDDEWNKKIAASKFGQYPGFGQHPTGHIALQHHGGAVSFRSIKVRDLDAPLPDEVALFNGTDLGGWKPILPDGADPADTWSVKDGILICMGQPAGYIRTERDFTNYVLKLEWRFNPVTKQAGNSGVLLRIVGPDKVWPRCVEAQLQSGNAGDFWNIDDFPMKTDPARLNGRNTRKSHFAEHPIGAWNEYEIIVAGSELTLNVNGETLNQAWDVLETGGKIGLQSEGAEIQFRRVRLAPIGK